LIALAEGGRSHSGKEENKPPSRARSARGLTRRLKIDTAGSTFPATAGRAKEERVMNKSIQIAPPNSFIVVIDRASKLDVPRVIAGRKNVAGTPSCIAIGTLCNIDGETCVSLTDQAPPGEPVYDGILETPKRRVSVCSMLLDPFVECDVPSETTRVRVWTNRPSEPDNIQIVVESAPG
jgi:hypothetical protein